MHTLRPPPTSGTPPPELGSIISRSKGTTEPWDLWEKLGDTEPLSQLHEKFWCKSMVEEQNAWREARKTVNRDEAKDKENVEQDEDKEDVYDDDDDDDDEDEDVTGPCRYVLDIGIEGLIVTKLWVRAEYVRIYDYCAEHCEK